MASEDFYSALNSIGINISTQSKTNPFVDIEETLIQAALIIPEDGRILSLCLSWIKVHGERINVERLKKLRTPSSSQWLTLFALFGVSCRQTRWKHLIEKNKKLCANGNIKNAQLRITMRGEEQWSKGTNFLIPKGSEPIDSKYVIAPDQLAQVNHHYRNKLIYGANWRADIATAIEKGAKNALQASKMCMSSYEPAHRIFSDFRAAGLIKTLQLKNS